MSELLRRAIREHRSIIWPLVAALVANVGIYAFAVYPQAQRSAGAADRAAAAAAARRAAEQEHEAATQLVAGKSRAEAELAAFYKDVIPATLTEARRLTYASLPTLASATNVRFGQRRFSVEEVEEGSHLSRLAIRMVLQGEYEDIRDFIYRLESAPEFIVIDDVTLTESTSDAPLTLTINLSTYFGSRPDGS